MKTVAFVPIKLNSSRLPSKNLLPLGEKPLCWHIVNTLLNVRNIDTTYVYCSDSCVIDSISSDAVFLQRDKSLDGEFVKGFEIYDSFTQTIDADVYVLAHTTSPFTKTESIQFALDAVHSGEYDSAFSAKKLQTFLWFNGKPLNYSLSDVPRTQDIEPAYMETSAFYIFKREIFTKYHRRIGFTPYIAETDEAESLDIDYPEDFELAKAIWLMKNKKEHAG